ncbi:hypothetical protein ACFLTT_03005 [Chloroflexota bacterium]
MIGTWVQPILIIASPAILTLITSRNVTLASVVLFVSLPLICWWLGVSGTLVIYSITLPCVVGFTHFLRTRRVADTSSTGSV